jgi:hypothetical protein
LEMAEEDRDKTSFVTRRGTFRFKRLAFGLTNAGMTFERVMELAMKGLNLEVLLVYLDDIVVFSRTPEEHLERLRELFVRLKRTNLKLKPSKCCIMRERIKFLGHVVDEEGVTTDPEKTAAVENWPVPRNVHEVRAYVGLAGYYRKHIKDFSNIARPLHALTQKQKLFQWTAECQEAFDEIKKKLVSSPILALPFARWPVRARH